MEEFNSCLADVHCVLTTDPSPAHSCLSHLLRNRRLAQSQKASLCPRAGQMEKAVFRNPCLGEVSGKGLQVPQSLAGVL